jgi:hypothetical protein
VGPVRIVSRAEVIQPKLKKEAKLNDGGAGDEGTADLYRHRRFNSHRNNHLQPIPPKTRRLIFSVTDLAEKMKKSFSMPVSNLQRFLPNRLHLPVRRHPYR